MAVSVPPPPRYGHRDPRYGHRVPRLGRRVPRWGGGAAYREDRRRSALWMMGTVRFWGDRLDGRRYWGDKGHAMHLAARHRDGPVLADDQPRLLQALETLPHLIVGQFELLLEIRQRRTELVAGKALDAMHFAAGRVDHLQRPVLIDDFTEQRTAHQIGMAGRQFQMAIPRPRRGGGGP